MENRSKKGYTVLQTVISGILEFNSPNVYGARPFEQDDPARPLVTDEEDYWDYLDYIVDLADGHGLYIGLLPCWTRFVYPPPGDYNEGNIVEYVNFLGERYGKKRNIIWILGGDRKVYERDLPMWKMMGAVLRNKIGPDQLITYHPSGNHTQSSASWFHDDDWLDFNMMQSGHQSIDTPNYKGIEREYNRVPIKPIMDAEPRYEQHSINWMPENGFFTAFDVRQAAYWAVFAGACGHTYGCRGVWQMYSERYEAEGPVREYWYEEMHLEGGDQMRHLKDLILSRPYFERIPEHTAISGFNYFGAGHIEITRGKSYLFAYSPMGYSFRLNMGIISGVKVNAWWFNPRSGEVFQFDTLSNRDLKLFNPPGDPIRGNDWVLVLDDAAMEFPSPGQGME